MKCWSDVLHFVREHRDRLAYEKMGPLSDFLPASVGLERTADAETLAIHGSASRNGTPGHGGLPRSQTLPTSHPCRVASHSATNEATQLG